MRYEPAAANPTATGCQPGTLALARAIRAVYPELQTLTSVYGCYNRRRIAGGKGWSLHAEGRAVDVGVRPERKSAGWSLACELVEHRITYGVQRVMWDGHIWSIERPGEWRKLQPGTDQHRDHVHLEQYRAAAGRPASYQAEYEAVLRRDREDQADQVP